MKGIAIVVAALVLAPAASADSIVFATDAVQTPVRLVSIGIDGRGARTLVAGATLDYRAGHRVSANDKTLLVDGRAVATVAWPIDDAELSPDGRRIAFTAVSEAHCEPAATKCATWELWLVTSDGTDLRELSPDSRYPRWSPDSRRLAFLDGFVPDDSGTAVVQDVASGHRTWFTYADDAAPSWSPDGTRIAYSSYGRVVLAAWSPRRVTRLKLKGFVPQFSPDGRSLAFGAGTGTPTLAVRGVTGGAVRIIATHITPTWTWASNGWLVYAQYVSAYPYSQLLVRVRVDGMRRAVLRRYTSTTYFDRIWPTAATLVFQMTQSRYLEAQIESVDLGTGAVRVLTSDLGDDLAPSYTAAGGLAYARGSATRYGWYCITVRQRCLTAPATIEGAQQPQWAPDGKRLAFLDYTKHGIDLDVMNADGSVLRTLDTFHGFVYSPSWSPDGETIVVSAADSTADPDVHAHLWLVNVASGGLTELDTGDWGGTPSWSPDGRTIAFVGGTWGGPTDLELYGVATGAVTTLVHLARQPVATARPAWSPDSTRLAYLAADSSLHLISLDGSGDRKLVDHIDPSGGALAWQS